MSLENLYHLRGLKIRNPGLVADAFDVTHLENMVAARNFREMKQMSSGDYAPCYQGLSGSDPSLTFSSTQIFDFMNMFRNSTASEKRLITDLSGGNLDMIYVAGKPNAVRELDTDARHLIGTLANNAAIYWNSLTVGQDEKATLSLIVKTSGTAAGVSSMAYTIDQALSGVNATPTECHELYSLGPVFYNGVQIPGVTNAVINNNVNEINFRSDGDVSTCYFGIQDFSPTATITTSDMDQAALPDVAGDGHEGLQANLFVMYLRKASRANYFVPNGTAEHIRITANAGLKTVPSISGDPAQTQLQFMFEKDPNNDYVMDIELGQIIP